MHEGAEAPFAFTSLQAGGAIDAFCFFHVEAHVVDALLQEELEDAVGVIEALLPQHADHMEGQSVAAQPANAPHRGGMAAQAGAGAAVGIVDKRGSVQAHPHADLVALEALTPLLIDQRAVGLDRLVDGDIPLGMTLQRRLDAAAGFVIEAHWQCQWLPGMPEQGEVAVDEGAAEQPIQDRIEQLWL